jgi:hypothetical protein
LFDPRKRFSGEYNRKLYAAYEIAYTAVDFGAAIFFVVGSILFLFSSLVPVGTWFFVVGSVFFALRPTIRLVRELSYVADDDYEDAAKVAKH